VPEKSELGKFLHTIPVTFVGSDSGVQNTYVQFIKELLWRMWRRRQKFTLHYGVLYFHVLCVSG